jgi:hypothetical protein
VKAILSAVYRQRDDEAERLSGRVRSRLALIETASECVRLLVEAPSSALRETLGTSAVAPEASDSNGEDQEKQGDG